MTPGKLGEVAQSYLLRETDGVPMARSAPIVVAERVTDLVALLVFAASAWERWTIRRLVVFGFALVGATSSLFPGGLS